MAESSKAEGDKKQFKTLDRRNGSKRLSLRHLLNRTPFRPSRSYSAEETHSISEKSAPPRQESTTTTVSKSIKSSKLLECPLCLNFLPKDSFPEVLTCDHRSCVECLRQYLRIEISESRVNIACPECSEKFHPNDIRDILSDKKLYDKYEDRMLRRVLVSDADTRWCPAPDCGFAVIAAGCASCPKIRCERPGCGTSFCYHCKSFWHPNQTCDSARAERNRPFNRHESRWVLKEDVKCCPKCQALIIKMEDGSCNHMTCSVCGAEFCWLCMKEISDLHYLSPSGCTFWGKKPWSRKKKILWQLGTLVGAPVGIGLIAGLAVPAMLIGIPVWVGRKVHNKYSNLPKGRKNALVTASVAASVLVSPVLAGLAVGIGVPILLAYVYGVVPVSLCRSGGCGLTTTDNGGVRIDLRDEEAVVGTTHSEKVNPDKKSIGPSIGEMSLGLNGSLSVSGSQMEKVGVKIDESDRESASHKAVAGGSITGSVSTFITNKLEVQADISIVTPSNQPTTKRASLSSESNKSAMDHEASSTKGLAGSLYSSEMERRSSPISCRSASLDETTKVGKRKVGSDGDRVSVNSWDDDHLKRNKRRSPSDDSCVLPEVEPSIVVRRVTLIEEESSSRQSSASSRL